MIHPLLLNARVLFVTDQCDYCMKYKKCIDKINSELKLDKRIEIVDCTNFHTFGIVDNPKIRLFYKYIQGSYPILFFMNSRKDGSNSVTEVEAWLRARLDDDFIYPMNNRYMWNKNCQFIKGGIFKRKIICD